MVNVRSIETEPPPSRDIQEALAIRAGSQTHPRIKKGVDLLVVGHVGQETDKLEKARSYGIASIEEHEYWHALGYPLKPLWGHER